MLDRIFEAKVHYFIYIISLIVIAIGMPFGKAVLSIGMVLMIINFLLEFKYISAFKSIKGNIPLIAILSFFAFLIIGLFWSIDPYQGLSDLKSRIPILVIPLIVGTTVPLSKKELSWILIVFLASIVLSSLINFLNYTIVLGSKEFIDIRGMSLFGSHIRYGIVIALGISVCICIQYQAKKLKLIYLLAIGWLLFYSYYSQVLSGYLSVTMIILALIFYFLWKWNKILATVTLTVQVAILVMLVYQFLNFSKKPAVIDSLPTFSAQGNLYYHSNEEFSEFNGLPIHTFVAPSELEYGWNKLSKFDFKGLDRKNHMLVSTIMRYMTALQLTKDSVGLSHLSKEDIRNIENGFTYPDEENQPFQSRMNGLRYQLLNEVNVNGHSLLQRFEYWKTSLYLIKKNGIFGVGTGGNHKAFNQAYVATNSQLNPEIRCRSHNMFFSVLIGQGILGLIIFLAMLFVLIRTSIQIKFLLGILFLAIIIPSFLIEDTLETQLGVTIFGFFSALIISEYRKEKMKSKPKEGDDFSSFH